MFRTVLFLLVLALCAFMAGWFTIDRNENETTIRFDRDEIRADASKAIAKGREILNTNGQRQGVDAMTPHENAPNNTVPYQTAPGQPPQSFGPGGVPTGSAPQQATRLIPPWELPPQSNPTAPPRQY